MNDTINIEEAHNVSEDEILDRICRIPPKEIREILVQLYYASTSEDFETAQRRLATVL